MKTRYSGIVLTLLAVGMLAGCGGSSTSSPSTSSSGPLVSGAAVKGLITGATVTVYELTTAGTLGGVVGSGTTDASGKFSFHLDSTPTGPGAIVISGTVQYKSEWTGAMVTSNSTMCAMVVDLSMGRTGLSITPLSDMACSRVRKLVSGGGTSTIAAIGTADTFVKGIYGLGASPVDVTPKFDHVADRATDGGKLAMILVALDKLRVDLIAAGKVSPASSDGIYTALSDDISDGTYDGKKDGADISLGTVSGVPVTLPFTAGSTDFVAAAGSLATDPTKVFLDATSSVADTSAISTSVSTITPGLGTVSPASVGLCATSSGAMSTLAFGGNQYLYVAARLKGVEKVDITNPAAPVVKGTADGWAGASLATHFTSTGSIGGATVVSGLTAGTQLLVFSYGETHIVLADPITGAVTWEGDLVLTNGIVSFSGGSAYIAGAIPVSGTGAWLATSDGYQFFDANASIAAGAGAAPVITATVAIDPTQQLAENLGGDVCKGMMIFAPNYNGLQVVNLTAKPNLPVGSYTADLSTASNITDTYFDGGSMDSKLGVGIMTNEDTSYASFINMNSVAASGVAASGVAATFVPAATNGTAAVTFNTTSYPQFSGSAVDSSTDQALFMAGYSSDIAVGQIQDPAVGGTWQGLTDWVDYSLSSSSTMSSYAYATDPHAVAVVNNGGKSYGYLLDGSSSPTGVVQIDMAALLAMPRAGTSGDALHQALADPTAIPVSGVAPITEIVLP